MHLARYNPVRFAHLPTPLEPLLRLTQALATSPNSSVGGGGPELWIKRDDCTGLAGGGNKTRKLEYLLGDARAHRGGRPLRIPGAGSNVVAPLGYVERALELVGQANEMGLEIDRIVTATGSAGTHAGLVAGLAVMGADIPVLGIGVRAPTEA